MRRILFASFGIALWACHGGGGDDNNNSIDASGSGTVDAGPPIEGTPYTISWGSVSVPSTHENTQCVVLQLPNTTTIQIHQIHNTTSTATHHVIVYKDDDPAAVVQSTPTDCQPFTGALNPSGMISPVMITQKQDDLLTLPDGVAYQFAAGQFIRLEMHYINTTDGPLTATETTTFYAADPATITDQADLLFIGSPDIGTNPQTGIAAGASFTLHQFFQPGASETFLDAKIFAITGHEHKTGTDVVVKTGTSATDQAMTTVYDPMPFQWSEPATTVHNPTFGIPAGGGFDFTCSYTNTTNAAVKFGESATNEMCFFWAYYYPAHGSHVCVHTNQFGSLNVCCPAAAGDQLATTVCSMIAP
ncbi:MAG: hypothetical protein ABI591_30800 [Kofleriaceae bacterium]